MHVSFKITHLSIPYFKGWKSLTQQAQYAKRFSTTSNPFNLGTVYRYERFIYVRLPFVSFLIFHRKNGQGFVLVYSIIAQSTFNDLPDIKEQITRVKDDDEVPVILVGNKCDLTEQRVIAADQGKKKRQKQQKLKRFIGKELASKWKNCLFMEASAKARINVDEVFTELIQLINKLNPQTEAKKKRAMCMLL
jgi:GTPase SAR1 family protein